MTDKSVTQLLREWRDGSEQARDELIPLVYRQLRALAGKLMASERPDHTFAATAPVHEAYLRLVDFDLPWQDRAHFFTLAVRHPHCYVLKSLCAAAICIVPRKAARRQPTLCPPLPLSREDAALTT